MSGIFSGFRRGALVCLATVGLLMTATACGPSHIQTIKVEGVGVDDNAKIQDTQTNREIIEVLMAYKNAMQTRDTRALKRLASDDYYENAGTTETTDDDYGHAGLLEALERFDETVRDLNFNMVIRDLRVEGDRAQVFYEYLWNFRYMVDEVPHWETGRDINRMDLRRDENGLWKITRGL